MVFGYCKVSSEKKEYSITGTSVSLKDAYAKNMPFGDHHRAELVPNISSERDANVFKL